MKKETEIMDSETYKEIGNAFFKKCQYNEAIENYTNAIEICSKKEREKMAIYFANRSNCFLHIGENQKALEDADKSISNNRLWWKGYFRKANVLFKMNDLARAIEQIEKALSLESQNNELNEFHQKLIFESRKVSKLNEEESGKSVKFNPNNLMEAKNIKEVEIEKFHEEYLEAYPEELEHYNILKEIHHKVLQINVNEFLILNTDNDTHINKEYLLSRFGVVGVDIEKFVKGKDVGGIIKEKNEFKSQYLNQTQRYINNFCHTPFLIDSLLTSGKKYAVIHPMDLNFLLNFVINTPLRNELIYIHFFFSCPFSYSKSLVLLDMIRRNVNHSSLIQVWYSSGWSTDTDNEFLKSCKNVLDNLKDQDESRTIIEYWVKSDSVKLDVSKREWLKDINVGSHLFYNFKDKKDRVEIMRYILTGELNHCNVGSRTMFINPLKEYQRCKDENFLHAINLIKVEYSQNNSFLSSIISYLKGKFKILNEHITQNRISIELFNKEISPKNSEYIASLKSNNYWIVYWSNLCDYYSRENFIKLAKSISSKDTIHSIYSLYWYQEVFGTEIYDYHSSSRRKFMEKVNFVFEKSKEAIKQLSFMMKIRENSIANLQERFLFMSKIMFKEKWAEYYFECLNRSKQCAYLSYFGLSAMESIIYLSFTFNNGIKLREPLDYVERV